MDKHISTSNIAEQIEQMPEFEIPSVSQTDLKEQIIEDQQSVVSNMNDEFTIIRNIYENVLSPELEKNEELKREQKKQLMNKIFDILKWQFIFTYLFVGAILGMVAFSHFLHISEKIVLDSISFIKFYITSIIVELISILFFIVKNVFDKSIVDLIRNFDKTSN